MPAGLRPIENNDINNILTGIRIFLEYINKKILGIIDINDKNSHDKDDAPGLILEIMKGLEKEPSSYHISKLEEIVSIIRNQEHEKKGEILIEISILQRYFRSLNIDAEINNLCQIFFDSIGSIGKVPKNIDPDYQYLLNIVKKINGIFEIRKLKKVQLSFGIKKELIK